MMKALFTMLLLVAVASAYTWDEFCKIPLEEKYLIQYERLKQIEAGTFANQYLTKTEAASWRASIAEQAQELITNYPQTYLSVLKRVMNVTQPKVQYVEAKMIKVGDHSYVSEEICKANPSACQAALVQNKTQVKTPAPNKRTPAECSAARQKDWDAFVYSNYPNVPTEGVNEAEKQALLDRMAEGYYSWQAKCLRGE